MHSRACKRPCVSLSVCPQQPGAASAADAGGNSTAPAAANPNIITGPQQPPSQPVSQQTQDQDDQQDQQQQQQQQPVFRVFNYANRGRVNGPAVGTDAARGQPAPVYPQVSMRVRVRVMCVCMCERERVCVCV